MISNSITHLQSYTNSTIADTSGNSVRAQISPRRAPNATHVSASRADIVASNGECSVMFHILIVFPDV